VEARFGQAKAAGQDPPYTDHIIRAALMAGKCPPYAEGVTDADRKSMFLLFVRSSGRRA